MGKYEELLKKAEDARAAGRRDECLRLKKEAEEVRHGAILQTHMARVEMVKKEFLLGVYIPELGAAPEKIEDGCGTEHGWIQIHLSNGKKMDASQIRAAVQKAKRRATINASFEGIKYPTGARAPVRLPNEYEEAIDGLLSYMSMDKIWTLEEWNDNNMGNFSDSFTYARDKAIAEGYTDEEAETQGIDAEQEEQDDAFNKYKGNVEEAVNYLLKYADLELSQGRKGTYYVRPMTSWHHSADKMAEVITGYGTFEYRSGRELKDGGPYKTYAEAIVVHLHWLKHGPEIYGNQGYYYMMR